VTDEKKPPPEKVDEWSAFQRLLHGIAKVPKAEVDEKEAQWQDERKKIRRAVR